MTTLDDVNRWYPDATTANTAVDRVLAMVRDRLGLEPRQVMLADSICCDDINTIEYPQRAHEMLGPFRLGGLSGFPFAGLAGMVALANHVPDNGALLVYFGPHIGVTRDGAVGKVFRQGQREPSACCGAASAALANLKRGLIVDGHLTELDHQFNALEQLLLGEKDRVLAAREPIVEATEVIYEATERRIDELVAQTDFPCERVVLMGAILINGDSDGESYSACRMLQFLDTDTGERRDWRSDFRPSS
jgi:hypothetical protein